MQSIKVVTNIKNILLNEQKALALFKIAEEIFYSSNIDKDKRQYKSESDTETLISAYEEHNK